MPAPAPAAYPEPFIALQSAAGAQGPVPHQTASALAWTMLPICRLHTEAILQGFAVPSGFSESEWQAFLDAGVPLFDNGLLTGLMGYWKLDETDDTADRIDSTGASVLEMFAAGALSVPGKLGTAINFNTTGAYENNNPAQLQGVRSASCWMKGDAAVVGEALLFGRYDSAPDLAWALKWADDGSVLVRYSTDGTNDFASDSAPGTVPPGAFHHVAFTQDDVAVKIYVDGSLLVDEGQVGVWALGAGINFALALEGGAGAGQTMTLDEVGLWSNVLTPAQIIVLAAGLPFESFAP